MPSFGLTASYTIHTHSHTSIQAIDTRGLRPLTTLGLTPSYTIHTHSQKGTK
jgi:hypothetical protein